MNKQSSSSRMDLKRFDGITIQFRKSQLFLQAKEQTGSFLFELFNGVATENFPNLIKEIQVQLHELKCSYESEVKQSTQHFIR